MTRPTPKAVDITYEVEVQHGDGTWNLFYVSETLDAAERVRQGVVGLGYAAARIVKVTREVLP